MEKMTRVEIEFIIWRMKGKFVALQKIAASNSLDGLNRKLRKIGVLGKGGETKKIETRKISEGLTLDDINHLTQMFK